jgi:diguanylate cyclase (GGDEF)-like protein
MSHPSRWSIRTILGLLIGMIGLLLIAVSVETLLDAGDSYVSSRKVAALSAISKPLLTSLIAARVERGTLANALIGENPIDADSVHVIADARREADTSYAQAMGGLAHTDLPGLADIAATLRASHAAAAALRARADAAVRQPAAARDPAIMRDEPVVFQRWVDATLAASEFVEPALMLTDPRIDQLLSIKRAAWAIRSSGGLIMNRSEAAVSSGHPWGAADIAAARENRGRVLQAWTTISAAMARSDAPAAIKAAAMAAERDFLGFFNGEEKGYVDRLEAGGMLTIGFAELQRRDTVAAVAIATVARTALSIMVQVADDAAKRAATILLLHAAALAAAVGLVGGALALVRRRIIGPLQSMTDTMRRLAAQDVSVDIPSLGRGDEIGAMAAAVQVFKDSIAEGLVIAAERERTRSTMHVQNIRFAAALGNMSQTLCMFDAADRLVVGQARLAELLGIASDALAPRLPLAAADLPTADARAVFATMARLRAEGRRGSDVQTLADGRTLSVSYASMQDDGWLVTLEDVTEQRLAEARIVHLAHHDVLTGLANRVLFHDRLGEAVLRCRRGARSAVLYLDLDHFKAVNDTLGHPVGDALLRAAAGRLREQLRDTDTIARLGGDEFAILLADVTEPEQTSSVTSRLIEAISAPYVFGSEQVVIGTSVGIALIPDDADDAEQIMKCADMALYHAKTEGRGRFRFFEAGMDARMQARRALDLDLRAALAEDQFQLHYQPQINLATGMVSGFEALVRWAHPRRGMVSPGDFIPLAEETGFIVPLGRWVLQHACADAVTWPGAPKVAVNISPVQFGSRSLVEDVTAVLAATGLDPHRLEIEITETVMLEDIDSVLAILCQLRDLGVGVALDDFGTGYSSLSHLRRFPFSKVKIDRSFIDGLGKGGDCDTIVAALVDLCERLGMATTAEGVETAAQLEQIAAFNCTEGQGYFFSRPRRADQVAELCRTFSRPHLAHAAAAQ